MITSQRRISMAVSFACAVALAGQTVALAQVPPSPPPAEGAPAPAYSAEELQGLVGPIALYPDDLVAIILPASTYPLQIVQASRFLDKRKSNAQLQPDSSWDDSVKSLLNYPDVVKKMSDDLEWTESLGEAVVANSSAVLDAVQAFRRRAQAAGSLKSDSRQKVVVEKEVITVVQADPQVIYVPQYDASAVVVVGAPPVAYYPTPYPVYYYPYPPGAALAAGIIWGAALGAAWNGGRWGAEYYGGGNSINNSNNITIDRGNNIGSGNRPGNQPGNRPGNRPGGGTAWKPSQKPGQVGRPSTRPGSPSRVGDARPGGGGYGNAGGARPSTQPAGPGGGRQDFGGARPSTQPAGPGGGRQDFGGAGRGDGGAFGGMGSGSAARQSSMRGQNSRAGSGGFAGGRQAGGFQGGGARAGGGARGGGSPGGGARSGGGARGGGRR